MNLRITTLVLLFAVSIVAAPLGNEFTYQGVLSDAGTPASGDFDFRFYLYDAESGGSQVGSVVYIEDLAVAEGRFTTQLDFGNIFDGTALWLEVGVRDGALTGAYTVLSPRQELTAAPFAQHAQSADTADTAGTATTAGYATTAGAATTAGDSDLLDGMDGSFYLTWSNFVGIPTDIADGDDDTLGDLTCSSDEIARWNGSAWNCSSDDDTPYARTFVVGPVGTTTQNGTALRNAITAITPPANQEEAVLLVLEPGTYDVGDTALPIWPWMTIEGAGERLTVITGSACTGATRNGTIHFEWNDSGLRHLGVKNTCNGTNAVALDIEGNRALIEHVAVTVEGGGANSNTCVNNTGMYLRMNDVNLRAANGILENTGLWNNGYEAEVVNVVAQASGGSLSARAVQSSSVLFTLKHGELWAYGNGQANVGLYLSGSNYVVEDIVADGGSATSTSRGIVSFKSGKLNDVRAKGHVAVEVRNSGSSESITMIDVEVDGTHQGILCDAAGSSILLQIRDGWILGLSNAAVVNEPGTVECNIFIRDSYLGSSTTSVSGLASCIATWNDTTFYTNTCPP